MPRPFFTFSISPYWIISTTCEVCYWFSDGKRKSLDSSVGSVVRGHFLGWTLYILNVWSPGERCCALACFSWNTLVLCEARRTCHPCDWHELWAHGTSAEENQGKWCQHLELPWADACWLHGKHRPFNRLETKWHSEETTCRQFP